MAESRYQAPAVRYPWRASRTLGLVLAALAGCGLTVLLLWRWPGGLGMPLLDSRLVVGLLLWLLGVLAAVKWWRRIGRGSLVWDGLDWRLEYAAIQLERPSERMLDGVVVLFDFQAVLLLRLRLGASGFVWLWLERHNAPGQWAALRRALFARQRHRVRGAVSPSS